MGTKRKTGTTTAGGDSPQKKRSEKKAQKPAPDWQLIENVVAALERAKANVPGMVITQKAQVPVYHDPSRTRDVDVLVRYMIGDRTFSLGIDAKNHGRRVDVPKIGQIIDFWKDVRLDRFMIVSTSGFTKDAIVKAQENKIELTSLEEFERSAFWQNEPQILYIEETLDVIHAEFLYSQDTPRAAVEPLDERIGRANGLADVVIENPSGSGPLVKFLNNCAVLANREATLDLKDQDLFTVNIDMTEQRKLGGVLRAGDNKIPLPAIIVATYRRTRKETLVKERGFRAKDFEASTSQAILHGELIQGTLITTAQPDGTKQLMAVLAPAQPKDVKVERET